MEWKDHLISTNIDRLLEYLAEHEQVSIEKASRDLGMPKKIIESWANALEDAGMITKSYSATKGTLLQVADKKQAEKHLEEIRGSAKENIEKASEELSKEHEEIHHMRETLEEISSSLQRDLAIRENLENSVEELKEEETQLEEDVIKNGADTASIKKLLNNIEKSLENTEGVEDDLESFIKRRNDIEKDVEVLKKLEKYINQLEESYNKKIGVNYQEVLQKTIPEVKEFVSNHEVDFDVLLAVEKAHKDRKTLKRWIRSQMSREPRIEQDEDSGFWARLKNFFLPGQS